MWMFLFLGINVSLLLTGFWVPTFYMFVFACIGSILIQNIYFYVKEKESIGLFLLIEGIYFLLGLCVMAYYSSVLLLVSILFFIFLQEFKRIVLHRYEGYSEHYQNRLLNKQVEEVEHIYKTMRGWRHDYHNHLQSLKVKLNQNQIEEARIYLDELEKDLDTISLLVESGNVNIDAILNSKLSLALEKGIDLNIKVVIPTPFPLKDIDACVLLGNLIDNAIESCEKVKENPFIRLYIGIYKNQLYISVSNATSELVRKMDEEYISHKRGNHGHGLKRINTIVEKYDGFISRNNEPGVFVSEIMIPINRS